MTAFSITFVPASWAIGFWCIRQKTLYAFGPFRFSIHRGLGKWKA